MTKRKGKTELIDVKELLERDEDFLQAALQALLQAALEAEMSATIGAERGERTETRLAYRSGYYPRSLVTRVGTLELRVPQDRAGRFSTELFQRYQRSEKALVGTLAEMYVQGVSTRKVKAVTEALCGHSFSASAISAINKSLDEALLAFAETARGSRHNDQGRRRNFFCLSCHDLSVAWPGQIRQDDECAGGVMVRSAG
jgi:putative transposase